MIHGSLIVSQERTRSPYASKQAEANSAKRSVVSRASQPPSSSSACGSSQW